MATHSLFDIIYSSTSTPLKLEADLAHENAQTEETKVRTQGEVVALQNQQAFQQAMAKIWGPGGSPEESSLDKAVGGDQAAQARMSATMSLYARYDPSKLPSMMNASEMAAKRQNDIRTSTQRRVGAMFSSIRDVDSYEAALPEITAEGGMQKFGLTGNYAKDKARVELLGRMGMSAGQQSLAELRGLNEVERIRHDQETEKAATERIQAAQARSADAQARAQQRSDLAAKHEERLRAEGQQRDNRLLASMRTKETKVNKMDLDTAMTLIKDHPEVKDLPANMRKVVAQDVAQMAKNRMAQNIKSLGDVPGSEEYSTAVMESLQKLVDNKKLVREYKTLFGKEVGFGTGKYHAERGTEKPADFKPANAPADSGKLDSAGEDLVQQVMSVPANKGIPREDVIRQLKAMGKL